MEKMIDELILQQDHLGVTKGDGSHLDGETVSSSICSHTPAVTVLLPQYTSLDNEVIFHYFNDHTKTRGFLNHEIANFTFIGPDRENHEGNDIQAYINMASAIQQSGVPYYKFA